MELRDSRQRLVAAQDHERRRLERDLHDGAQQQLVALKLKLNVAKTLAEREHAPRTAQLIDQLATDTDDAVTTLRELAHGIYPPLLAAEGLPAALTTQARKAPITVTLTTDPDLPRFDQDTEAAVYFCVLEALQNAAKYGATTATITLHHTDQQLTFTVTDNGPGFDPHTTAHGHGITNMTDRLDALDGHLHLTSTPGQGTTLTGILPATASDLHAGVA